MSTEFGLTEAAAQMNAQCPLKDVIEKTVYIQERLITKRGQRQEEEGEAIG